MALTFLQVPDWTSFENQGANIAVADLDQDGLPELIVLRVDHPTPGPNRGFYRVGRGLTPRGTSPAGGVRGLRFRSGTRKTMRARASPWRISETMD